MAHEKKSYPENLPPKFTKDTHRRLAIVLEKTSGICYGSALTLGMVYLTSREHFDTTLERLAIVTGGTAQHDPVKLQGRITSIQVSMAQQAAPARINVFQRLRKNKDMLAARMQLHITGYYPRGKGNVIVDDMDKKVLNGFNVVLQRCCDELTDTDYQKDYDVLIKQLKKSALDKLELTQTLKEKLYTHCEIQTHVSFSDDRISETDEKKHKISSDERLESVKTHTAKARFQEEIYHEVTKELKPDDKQLANFTAMSNAILLLHEPNLYKKFLALEDKDKLKEHIPHENTLAFPLIQPIALESTQNSIVDVYPPIIGCYDYSKKELSTYLQRLLYVFNKHSIESSVMFYYRQAPIPLQ